MSKVATRETIKRFCPPALFRALQRFSNRRNISAFKKAARRPLIARKIVFLSPTRKSLSGNFQFIAQALEGRDFLTTFLFEQDHQNLERVMDEIADAHYIIADDYVRYMYSLPLRPHQRFIQVWHSAGAFKRMGFARMGREGSTIRGSLTHRNYTDVIVSSPGVVDDFALAFGVDASKVKPLGIPRTDVFFDDAYLASTRERMREKLGIMSNQRLIVFAPTYRGNDLAAAHYPASFIDIDALARELPADCVLGIKMHPFIKQRLSHAQDTPIPIIDLSDEREINDVLIASDMLITDYSSVIFEYAFLKKPLIFYVPDIQSYTKSRDFFYPFGTYVYGEVATTQEELARAVRKSDGAQPKALDSFIEKFLGACDGHASQRFVEEILQGEAL